MPKFSIPSGIALLELELELELQVGKYRDDYSGSFVYEPTGLKNKTMKSTFAIGGTLVWTYDLKSASMRKESQKKMRGQRETVV